MEYTNLLKTSPNLVIYGKSGTGKTFAARKLVEDFEKENNREINFSTLEKQGRAKFISFHESYSYHDFIERRISFSDEEKIEEGILPEIANLASLDILKAEIKKKIKNSISLTSKIWKVSLGYRRTEERIYRQCKRNKEIVIGWLEYESLEGKSYNEIYSMLETKRGKDEPKLTNDVSSINALVNDMKKGDFVLIYATPTTITDIGIVESDYFHEYGEPYPHKRKVVWLKEFGKQIDISAYDNKTRLSMKTIYDLDQINFSSLREIIKDNQKKVTSVAEGEIKPYYLIIDNVDSVNISNVFGESLSLLDKESRDNYKTKLMYSKKNFSLPSNLYIIATAKDIFTDDYLQRRFLFIKNDSGEKYLENIIIENKDFKIKIVDIFNQLNDKVFKATGEKNYLGYAYFINIKNIDELYNNWYYKIIPVLRKLDLSFPKKYDNNISNQAKISSKLVEILGDKIFDNNELIYLNNNDFKNYIIKFIN